MILYIFNSKSYFTKLFYFVAYVIICFDASFKRLFIRGHTIGPIFLIDHQFEFLVIDYLRLWVRALCCTTSCVVCDLSKCHA